VIVGCSGGSGNDAVKKFSLKVYTTKGEVEASMMKFKIQSSPGLFEIKSYDEYYIKNETGGLVNYYLFTEIFDDSGNYLDVNPNDVKWSCNVPGVISPETGMINIDFKTNTPGDYIVTVSYMGESKTVTIKAIQSKAMITGTNWLGPNCAEGMIFSTNSPTSDLTEADLYIKNENASLENYELIAPYGIKNIGKSYFYLNDIQVNPLDLDFSEHSTGFINMDLLATSFIVKCKNGKYVRIKLQSGGWSKTSSSANIYFLPID
jgi:hypothetical protein